MSKVLTIDTVLGKAERLNAQDPLLLTSLDGWEGVSAPFVYDLVLARDTGLGEEKVRIDKLLGSEARIGLLTGEDKQGKPKYVHRVGCFSHFEKIGVSKRQRRLVYKARLIPAVMLWGGGVTYRVFERKNVVDIIKDVLSGIRAPSVDVRFDASQLRNEDFPRLAYCVQFRESSFGFVCRLMAQYGISYFFDRGSSDTPDAENDTLVLIGPDDNRVMPDVGTALNAKNVDVQGGEDIDDRTTIAGFARSYRTSRRIVSVGDYNPISPADPLHAEKTVAPRYDVMSRTGLAKNSVLGREEFPAGVYGDPDAEDVKKADPLDVAGDENRFVKGFAENTMRREEIDVFTVSGMVKNADFIAGRTFQIERDETLGQFDQRQFVLTRVKITAFEHSYMTSTGNDFSDLLLGLGSSIVNAVTFNAFKKDDAFDVTEAIGGVAWDHFLQQEQQYALANWWHVKPPDRDRVFPAMASQWPALLFANALGVIKDIVKRQSGRFTIRFAAVPRGREMFLLPQVSAPRPVAEGPQLATVVGPRESKKGELFVDHQLGRVRVRFPWQLKGPAGAEFTDRFDTNHTTAWVPVSQAWAGTNFGSQFLPRIGDQVLVEYLDGDPERPIITGRVYHADQGYSNLPFLNERLAKLKVTTKTLFNAAGQSDVTLSGIETRSIPQPDKGQNRYHLLRFDDHYNDEQILMRSQGRLDVTAKCCHYETTEGNRHVRVVAGKDADGKTVGGGSSFMTVGGEHDEHIGDSRYEAVDKDQQLTVKGDTQFDLKGDWINVVGGKLSLNATTIVIEASQKLTLKVGGSTVVLNPCGVYHDGPLIPNQGGGPADSAADAKIKDVADASKADPGEPGYMRTEMPGGCKGGGGGGGGGKRGEHTVPAQHGLPCTLDSERMICLPLAQLCTADGDGK